MPDTAIADTLSANDVAAYLRQHPEFLSDYPDLASQLTLPREQGRVASLAVYQLQSLREKNTALEQQLASLISVASENERLTQRVHELSLTVLRAATPADAAQAVVSCLKDDFHVEPVRLLVYGPVELPPADWLVRVDGAAALPEFADFLAQHEPVTGRLSSERLQKLFGEQAGAVKSSAILPLGDFGILAIGSHDADHFQPGMGTLFLRMIAATVGAALRR